MSSIFEGREKADVSLGEQVKEYLRQMKVETPMAENDMGEDEKIAVIEENTAAILEALGLDLTDDSLRETPRRVAKMFVRELFWGLDYKNFPKCTTVDNKMRYDEMVVEKGIKVISDCEHHIRPINGVCHVAYIPKQKVLGLSKLNRIVEFFSRRPQIQERLAEQIFHALVYVLETDDVAVMIDAEHFCVKQRGVEDCGSRTVTSKLGGKFKNNLSVRAEFMGIVRGGV